MWALVPLLALANVFLILFALGYGIMAAVGGRIRLARSRVLRGWRARAAGLACVAAAVAFWWFSAYLWRPVLDR